MSKADQNQPIEAEMDEIDPSEMWTAEERDEYFAEMEDSPLLMDKITDEDRKHNTNIQALESIIQDNRSNEEMVEDFQHEAKLSFAKGRCMYTKAYTQFKKAAFYAEKLEKTPENLHLLATLYANCSLIQLKKENFRTCLTDCKKALDIEPRYKKVLYRKAKALAGLNDLPGALECCSLILEDEPDNVYTLKLKSECESRLRKEQKRNEEIALSEQRKEAAQQLVRKTLDARGYQLGPTMYTYPDGYKTPFAVKEDELIFPMLILFPEHTQSNIVQSVAESDTFADILYTILPSAQGHQEYMPWDEEKQYTVSNVEVWFQEFLVLPYPKEGTVSEDSLRQHFQKQRYVRANRNFPVSEVLRYRNYVIPGIPVFSVYAKNACLRDLYQSNNNEMYQLTGKSEARQIHRCHNCGRYEDDTEEFKKCSRCKKTFYCSRQCQIADWKVHKQSCKPAKE